MQFYDATQWQPDSGLAGFDQLNTTQTWWPPGIEIDVKRAVDADVGVYLIDLERGPAAFKKYIQAWLDSRGQDELTDEQLCAAMANIAKVVRKIAPKLRIGAWLEGRVTPGPYVNNLAYKLETYNGTAKDGLPYAVDFICVPAHWSAPTNLDGFLSWRPQMIREFREHIGCQLYAGIMTTALRDSPMDGILKGDVVLYEKINRIYEAIADDVNGIIWWDFPGIANGKPPIPYRDDLPYMKVTKDNAD